MLYPVVGQDNPPFTNEDLTTLKNNKRRFLQKLRDVNEKVVHTNGNLRRRVNAFMEMLE